MKLKTLLKKANISSNVVNHKINLITDDSKEIVNNSIFISIKGFTHDGDKFIEEAIKKGAKTIIHEDFLSNKKSNINYIKVDNTKKIKAILLNEYYRNITKKIKIIGVTGTNGKTTISTLIYNFFMYNQIKALLIGTNGIFFNNEKYEINNTTPDIKLLLKVIKEAVKKRTKYLIMEVSSHSIKEQRIFNIEFDYIIFTNLSHDHLDYHKSFLDYKNTKGIFLSSLPKNKTIIMNKDDDTYFYYNKFIRSKIITYSINRDSDYKAIISTKEINKTVFNINSYNFTSYLTADFNVLNLTAVIALLNQLKYNNEIINNFFKIFNKIDGRNELLKIKNRYILIDFAHTPKAINLILQNLNDYKKNRLITVVGCGGDRDKEKRNIIGKIVTNNSDYVIFTSDNSRNEKPEDIINDIIKNIKINNFEIIENRYKAIKKALQISKEKDIIAILGKGSEEYQIINNIKHPFNDKEVVNKIVRRIKLD